MPIAVMAAFTIVAWTVTGTPCVLQSTVGLPCPGCGLTRAVRMAFQGDVAGAFRMHPLFPVGVVTLAALPFLAGRMPGFLRTRSFRVFGLAVILAFLAVYAIRMATLFPDTPPMIYNVDSFIGRLLRLTGLFGH